jgi:hypothetical protein
MSTLQIDIGRQSDGCVYMLHPRAARALQERFPGVHRVPSVFIGYDARADFETMHGPLWKQIATILTGLTWEQIEGMGGVTLYDPMDSELRKVA